MKKIVGIYTLWFLFAVMVSAPIWSTGQAEGKSPATEGQAVKLTVELFDRNNTPKEEGTLEDNRWTRWIHEEMLKQGVDIEFFPVPRGEEQSKLNILMGSGSAPDVVFTYNRYLFAKFALDGGLNDLSDSLSTHGPQIRKVLGDEILDYGILDGKQYSIPARRSSTAHRTSFIRKDWLDALGLPVPTNKEELFRTLVAFKKQDPGNIGSDKVIPWGYYAPESSDGFEPHSFRPFNAMYSFMKNDKKLIYTTPWPLREGFKEFAGMSNQMYKAGLLDKEFATETDELSRQKLMNGQVGFFCWSWWGPTQVSYGDVYRNMRKNVPGAEWIPVEVFENSGGEYPKIMYPPVGLYIMSPATAKNTDAMVKYLNWMASEEAGWMITFGVEGEHYELVDGAPLPIDPDYNQKTRDYILGDLRLLFNGPYPIPQEIDDKITMIDNGDLGEFAIASRNMALRDGFHEVVFNEEIDAWSKYGPEIVKACDEYWIKMTMADDFEAMYQEFMQQLKARNIDEVVAEREAYYEKYF